MILTPPKPLSILFELAKEINKQRIEQPQLASQLGKQLRQLGNILGLLQVQPATFLQASSPETQTNHLSNEEIEQLIAKRQQARQQKDWATADQIRHHLTKQGIILEDSKQGTSWRKM
jgi:cysteinyl-tRNA synthetase